MKILVVYCHPSKTSFTFLAKEAFLKGLSDAGHSYEVSDLYEMKFSPVLSESEYRREAYYEDTLEIPTDVKAEQDKIEKADCLTFIFPNFWTAAPALLEGWFQRVWTYGYAYGEHRMKVLLKTVFVMTMGGSLKDPVRQEQIDSIKCSMIGDRMFQRTCTSEFYVFDEMTRGYGNDENRLMRIDRFTKDIYQIGFNIEK